MMYDDFDEGMKAGLSVGFLLTAAFAVLIVLFWLDPGWQREAVDHGCAEYYLDADDERQWRWIAPEESE